MTCKKRKRSGNVSLSTGSAYKFHFDKLLLQLAQHLTKNSGRGLSLLRAPSIPPGNAATDIEHFRELVRNGNFTIEMDFKLLALLLFL